MERTIYTILIAFQLYWLSAQPYHTIEVSVLEDLKRFCKVQKFRHTQPQNLLFLSLKQKTCLTYFQTLYYCCSCYCAVVRTVIVKSTSEEFCLRSEIIRGFSWTVTKITTIPPVIESKGLSVCLSPWFGNVALPSKFWNWPF